MTTVLFQAKKIRRQASKGYRHEVAVLLGDMNATQETLATVTTPPAALRPGALLCAELEVMLVTAVAINTISVVRAFQDSTATAHVGGTQLDISPRFSLLDIVDAMQSEITTWSPQLFYPASMTATVATSSSTYELPLAWSGMLGLLEVLQADGSTAQQTWPRLPCKLIRGAASTFAGAPTSGMLVRFTEPIRLGSVFLTAALPYQAGTLVATTDLETNLFLTEGMLDLLSIGAKRRLMLDEVQGRMARQAQDEARRAEETPIGSLVPLAQMENAIYQRRMQEEINRLRHLYPYRIV